MTATILVIVLIVAAVLAGGPIELLRAMENVLRSVAGTLREAWVSFTR
jgi:hypothetical protein